MASLLFLCVYVKVVISFQQGSKLWRSGLSAGEDHECCSEQRADEGVDCKLRERHLDRGRGRRFAIERQIGGICEG